MVVEKHNSPIIVHGSDSEEYEVSDIELNDAIIKLLDTATVAPTASSTTGGTRSAGVAPSPSMVVERRRFPIIIHGSDSEEYVLSDIELDNNILRLLDEID